MDQQFRVKITHNEKGQNIQIPNELELSDDEVVLRKMGPYIVLAPVKRRTPAEALASLEPINVREFRRVAGLRVENWLRDAD